jgi:hypothetical protein
MEAEHCTLVGFDLSFRTSNYTEIESNPRKEWEIVMKRVPCPPEHMRFNWRIPDLEKLLMLPTAKKAGLTRAEIIAIVMYTGPMVTTRIPCPNMEKHMMPA